MKLLFFVLACVALLGATSPGYYLVENSYGCTTGALGILDDSLRVDRDCDGTFDTVLVEDTSKAMSLYGIEGYAFYSWDIDSGTSGADSATFKEVVMCSTKTIGAWVNMVDITSNTDKTVDSIVTVTYGVTGKGAYEAYFSRCDAVKFITRVLAGSGGADTTFIQKRALKVE